MKRVYCLSGLGADRRIFSRLEVPGVEFVHLDWIVPRKNETIGDYAGRMSEQLPSAYRDDKDRKEAADPYRDLVFMGVSFGGMMAVEMAKSLPGARVILISSVVHHRQLPLWMKWAGRLQLNRLVPSKPWKWTMKLGNSFLGARTEQERQLCNEFRRNADPVYLHWAIRQVLNWRNEWKPAGYAHIHGNRDRTFPIGRISPTHIVRGGGHFMVMTQAGELSAILAGLL